MANDEKKLGVLMLRSVRGAFLNVWTARAFSPDQDPRFSALFLMEKDGANHKRCNKVIDEVIAGKWKSRPPGLKLCLRPAEEKEGYDGFVEGLVFVSTGSKVRPGVYDRKRNPLAQEDGVVYSGAYYDVKVRFWAQDNQWGKRVNAELLGLQFVKDGEPFSSGGQPASADDFDEYDDDDSEASPLGEDEDDLLA